jgi:hypothetical protein
MAAARDNAPDTAQDIENNRGARHPGAPRSGRCSRCRKPSETKTCTNCREYNKQKRALYAATGRCIKCSQPVTSLLRECLACSERGVMWKERDRRTQPWKRAVEALSNHGVALGTLEMQRLARRIWAGGVRCSICGLPTSRMRWWRPGSREHWSRMSLDRIVPDERLGGLTNLRLLCRLCNVKRGAGRHSDDFVWGYAKWFWIRWFGDRCTMWLYKTPPSRRQARTSLATRWRINDV